MIFYVRNLILPALALLLIASCAPIGAQAVPPTPTDDIPATQVYERSMVRTELAGRRTQEARESERLAVVQQTLDAREQMAAAATQGAADLQERIKQTSTQAAADREMRQNGTATAAFRATEQVSAIYQLVQNLHAEEIISTSSGTYHRLDDFDQSWAQMHWYQWWRTGLKLENFVVRLDAEWASASKTADWFSSGCGFVFAENGTDDHFASFLALDGNVYNRRVQKGVQLTLPGGYYGRVDTPEGGAELVLVVDQGVSYFFVNGKRVSRFTDSTLSDGAFALTLNSGTNLDFGTRCTMKNIDVWELDSQ